MIRVCTENDFPAIAAIINDAASAYRGVIPEDCYHEPYMPDEELADEIARGVRFSGYEADATLVGVMGIEPVKDVTLIRHAYVRTTRRGGGIGGALLKHLRDMTDTPILIGTWAAAEWAVRFYEARGFRCVSHEEKENLLRIYWTVPDRQIETSVVLACDRWDAD
jgi:N-acetylglutamate synthase-like GNAT family acetyltransferase